LSKKRDALRRGIRDLIEDTSRDLVAFEGREPKPHVHNSGWVQSPGAEVLKDPARHGEVERYVKGVIGRFRDDRRILGWDVINEPDNPNHSSYGRVELPDKAERGLAPLRKSFAWAREADPSPCSHPWRGAGESGIGSRTRRDPAITRSANMPAGLTATDSMFSVREVPWHGLGAVLDHTPSTIAEAIDAALKHAIV